MRKLIRRTAMVGGGLSYDVYVPVEDVEDFDGTRYTTIIWNGRHYLNYVDATRDVSHFKMPKGIERYEVAIEHRKKAEKEKLEIIQAVFPETKVLEDYPTLWVNNLLPKGEKETHAEIWVD